MAEDKEKREPIMFIEDAPDSPGASRIDGRLVKRKSVTDDKLQNISSIADNTITNAMMTNDAIKQAELDYETVTLAFDSGDTSKTASVTSGSIIIGFYTSSVTSTPATGELQLAISSTILTGTRSAAPGGASAITYTVVLLKA